MDNQEHATLLKDHVITPDGFEYFEHKGTIIFIHDNRKGHTPERLEELIGDWTEAIDLAKLILRYIPESSDIQSSVEGVQTLVENEIKDGIFQPSIAVVGFGSGGLVALIVCLKSEELAGVGCCSTPISDIRRILNDPSLIGNAGGSTDVYVSHLMESPESQQQLVREMLSKGFEKVEHHSFE